MSFRMIVRGLALIAMTACAAAVLIGRSAPRAAVFRLQADSHRTAFNPHFFSPNEPGLRILDAQTGKLSLMPMPQRTSLQWASFSDWLDDRGQWQVVGHWKASNGAGTRSVLGESGFARMAYPSGTLLNFVSDTPLPVCSPCWYPGLAQRVLFASADGRLIQCEFAEGRLGGAAKVQSVSWARIPAGLRDPRVSDITWPRGLNGCLVAALRSFDASHAVLPNRLWWLRLSSDGLSIAEAGRLMASESKDESRVEWSFPSVGSLPDGRHVIAYQRREKGRIEGELFLAPLRIDAETGAPVIDHAARHKLADDIVGAPAAIAPDGQWVYAVQRHRGEGAKVLQIAVP